jgi:hypothetical protein
MKTYGRYPLVPVRRGCFLGADGKSIDFLAGVAVNNWGTVIGGATAEGRKLSTVHFCAIELRNPVIIPLRGVSATSGKAFKLPSSWHGNTAGKFGADRLNHYRVFVFTASLATVSQPAKEGAAFLIRYHG